MLGTSCAEPSEARLRAADQEMVCFTFVRARKTSDGKGKLQNGSSPSRCGKRCFVQTPLARFPFLLIQVFVFVVRLVETIHFGTHRGYPKDAQIALGLTGIEQMLTFSNLDPQASSGRSLLVIWIDRCRANAHF